MPFAGVDYYALDELLTDDERLVRDTFRRFVDEECMPIVAKHFRAGTFPRELPPKLGALGALGASLEGYGCAGLGPVAYGLIMQELERCDSGFRSFCSVQGSLVMFPIHAYGSPAQKERWLPPMAKGEAIGCFGLTEPDFGSNPRGAGGARLPRRKGRARLFDPRHRGQVLAARIGHQRARLRGLRRAARRRLAGRARPARAAVVLEPGALRHRLGRRRRGHGLLRR